MKNIALVGFGYWGKNLARNLRQLGLLHTICDQDKKALDNARRNYADVRGTAALDDILSSPEIKGVVVATPAATHYAVVKKSLFGGKHVMVEKPFTTKSGEAEELVALADQNRLHLMVGFTFLYNSAVMKVKNLIDSGEIGDVRYVYSQRLNLGIVRKDVDAWWNLGPHDVSIMMYWLGDQVVQAGGWGASFLQPGIDDVVMASLRFRSGVVGYIHVSWLDPNKVRRMTVVGSKKMVVYDDASPDMRIQIFDKGVDRFEDFHTFGQFQLIHRAGDLLIPKIDFDEPLSAECKHFAECIESGKEPLTSGRRSLPVVRVMEAVATSMKGQGALVSVG
jgi:predicted dehydrogenase